MEVGLACETIKVASVILSPKLVSFPGSAQFSVASSTVKQGGPGIFSHISDIRIERMVERVYLCVGARDPEQQKEPWYLVAHHMCLASGRWLSYSV